MKNITTLIAFLLSSFSGFSQSVTITMNDLYQSIDKYYGKLVTIQSLELSELEKFKLFAYAPNIGYSPFLGGLNVSISINGILGEIRNRHKNNQMRKAIASNNDVLASELKNSISIDYYAIKEMMISDSSYSRLDSLQRLQLSLLKGKFQRNELTPSDYINAIKADENYWIGRRKTKSEIKQAIIKLAYKAKMDVTSDDIHFIFHP